MSPRARGCSGQEEVATTDKRQNACTDTALRFTIAQLGRKCYNVIWPDAFSPLLAYLGITNTHEDQLTLAEFCAIRTRRLLQNLDMIAIARTVRLTEADDKSKAAEQEDDDLQKGGKDIQCEFMGGEHDLEEEEEAADPTNDLQTGIPNPLAQMDIKEAKTLLQRDAEIEAAGKPGRRVGYEGVPTSMRCLLTLPPPRSATFSKRSPFRPARFLLLRMVTRTAVWIKLMRLCRASSVPQILSEKPLIIHPQVSAVSLVLEALRFSGSPVLACTHFIT